MTHNKIDRDISRAFSRIKLRIRYLSQEQRRVDEIGIRSVSTWFEGIEKDIHLLTYADVELIKAFSQIDATLEGAYHMRSQECTLKTLQKHVASLGKVNGEWRQLQAVIYSYWRLRASRMRRKNEKFLDMLEILPASPSLLLESKTVIGVVDSEEFAKKKAFRSLLKGELKNDSLQKLSDGFEGLGFKVQEKEQLSAAATIHRLVEDYQKEAVSLQNLIMRCKEVVDDIETNTTLLHALDKYLEEMPLHKNEATDTDISKIRALLPNFALRLEKVLDKQKANALKLVRKKLLALSKSPWPWRGISGLQEVLPRDASFEDVRRTLQTIAYGLRKEKRDLNLLNELAEAFNALLAYMKKEGLEIDCHQDLLFLTGSFPINPDDTLKVDQVLQKIHDKEHAQKLTRQFYQVTSACVLEVVRGIVVKGLLSEEGVREGAAIFIQYFPDLDLARTLINACKKVSVIKPEALDGLLESQDGARNHWCQLEERVRAKIRGVLQDRFEKSLDKHSPVELEENSRWMLDREFSDVVMTDSVQLWLKLISLAADLSRASGASAQNEAIKGLFQQMEVAKQYSLPACWIDTLIAHHLYSWFKGETLDHVAPFIPVLFLCFKAFKKEKQQELDHWFIQLATSGEKEVGDAALKQWRDALSDDIPLARMNALLALKNGENAAEHLKRLDRETWKGLSNLTVSGEPLITHFHNAIPRCKTFKEFMTLVEFGKIVASPVTIDEVPESLLKGESDLQKIWEVVTNCIRSPEKSPLETTLPALRFIQSLRLIAEERDFLKWYLKQRKSSEVATVLVQLLDALKLVKECELTYEEQFVLFPETTKPRSTGDSKQISIQEHHDGIRSLLNHHALKANERLDGLFSILRRDCVKTLAAYLRNMNLLEELLSECLKDKGNIKQEIIGSMKIHLKSCREYLHASTIKLFLAPKVWKKEESNYKQDEAIVKFLENEVLPLVKEFQEISFDYHQILSKDRSRITSFNEAGARLISALKSLDLDSDRKELLSGQLSTLRFGTE